MSIRLLHKKSSVPTKTPLAEDLLYGELAINYAASGETFSIKNSENEVVTFPMYKIEKMSEDLSVLSGSVSANATSITNEVTRATKSEKEIQNTINTISNNLSTVSSSLYTFLESNKIEGTVDTLKEIQEFIENNGTADIIKDINTINENITNISGDTISNAQVIEQANNDILTLQTTISSVSGDVNTINSTITSIQKNINNLSSTTLDHTTQLTSISSQLNNVASDLYTFLEDNEIDETVDNLTEIQEFINTVNDNVSILSGDITTVSGKADTNAETIEAISGVVANNITNIETVSGKADANTEAIKGINADIEAISGVINTNITNIETVSGTVSANTIAVEDVSTRLKGGGNANPHLEPFKRLAFADINDILPYFQDIITESGLSVTTFSKHTGEYRIFISFYMYNVKFAVDINNYTATITVSGTLDIDEEELVISPNYAIVECQCVYDENEQTQEWGNWKYVGSSTEIEHLCGQGDASPAYHPFKHLDGDDDVKNLKTLWKYFDNIIGTDGSDYLHIINLRGTYRAYVDNGIYWVNFAANALSSPLIVILTISGALKIDSSNNIVKSNNYNIVERICTISSDNTKTWSDWKLVASSDFQEQIINNQTAITQINSDIQIINNNVTSLSGTLNQAIDDFNDYHINLENNINANTTEIENLQNMVNDLINRISILESKQNMATYILDAQGSYANDELTINDVNGIEMNVDNFNNTYDENNEMLQ